MSKLKVTTIANVADSESTDVTNVINGSAKAWVNFDGTFGTNPFTVANGGIRAAFNVSSVTDNGNGDYTVNLTNALADANYSVVVSADPATGAGGIPYSGLSYSGYSPTSSTVRVRTTTSSAFANSPTVCVTVFR